MDFFFVTIYNYLTKNKIKSFGIILSFLLVLFFFASRISFQENITQLIPSNSESDITSKVLKQVNFADKITILIKKDKIGTVDDLTSCANNYINSIKLDCKPYVSKIQGKLDEKNIQETFDFVYENLPLFLDEKDYYEIQSKINKDSIKTIVEKDYKSIISPTGIVTKDFILKDPMGLSFIALKKLQQLSVGEDFAFENGFVLTKDKKNLLLFLTPKLPANETDRNALFLEKLEQIQNNLNKEFKGRVTISYFGTTPVAVANATQIKADVKHTSIFAALALILILAFFYRSALTPIIIFIPSIFGAITALAILFFTKGTISAISLGISSILLGETTDYSIYVLTHLRKNKDIKLLYKDISKPLILCGSTTAITFLCLYFVKSEALKDLGLFSALSVMATSVFSLFLIPLLYKPKTNISTIKINLIDKIGSYPYHKNKLLVGVLLFLLIICFFNYNKVGFNKDLSALNYMPTEIKKTQDELENITNVASKSIYLVSYGKTLEAALDQNNILFEKLHEAKQNKKVLNFSSIGGIVFSKEKQQQKIKEWNTFWLTKNKIKLKAELIFSGNQFGFKQDAFYRFYETLDKDYHSVSLTDYAKVKSFFIDEFISGTNSFYTASTLVKVANEERDAFVTEIKKYSNLVVIDRQETNETFLSGLKNNFERLVNFSFIAIFIILLLAFRRVELVIISMIPIFISLILTTGIMGMFGIEFNIINIIVCTLIFGIGVDYSIFMTTALQKEHTYGKTELPAYKTSILLSVTTTILGIGVLIFAHHPALKSIALIAIIGIFSAGLITLVLQPLVFNFFISNRVQKGRPPFQLRTFLHGILSFVYYGIGGFFMSLFSMTLMNIIPLSGKMKMKGFRYVISKFMKSVLFTNPFVKKEVINETQEDFQKPAVIIANHTSVLDILALGMLSPKTIYLVSDWVYNSPIFGGAVRKAGFYPVSEGLEWGVEHLRKKIEEGYSLIVFPEGTRSNDNMIKRFHKGAFYLAEHFNLDILPVIIHGNSEVLPKGEFIIYDGAITVNVLKRISPENDDFGKDYVERTKKIAAYFKVELNKVRKEREGVNYFKKILINSFFYKENKVYKEVVSEIKRDLPMYYVLNKYIDAKANIAHIGSDYGQLEAYLTLQEPQRKIISFNRNQIKREVAQTNYINKIRKIKYVNSKEALLSDVYDILLLSDIPDTILDYKSVIIKAKEVITVNSSKLNDIIINFGFEIETETNQLVVLKNKQK